MEWWWQLDTFTQVSFLSGVVFFLLTVWLALALHRSSQRNKRLVVSQSRPQAIALLSDQAAPIKIEYNGVPVEHVSRTLLLFRNRGHEAIEHSDFVGPIVVNRSARGGRMLGVGVLGVDLKTNVRVEVDDEKQVGRIFVDMLRPGEAALVYFDSDKATILPNLQIDMKSPKWVRGNAGLAALQPKPAGYVLALASLFPLMFVAGQFGDKIISPAVLLGAVFVIPIAVAIISIQLIRDIRGRLLSPTVVDFYRRTNVW